jgi:hypothetical protein
MLATGILAVCLTALGSPSFDGSETLGPPSIGISPGTTVVLGGVGLINAQPGTIELDVPMGASVEQVLLYVEGANSTSMMFTPTMSVMVDGNPVVMSFIGGNTGYGPNLFTSSYRADITSLGVVGPGMNTVVVGGLDFDVDNDGAGILAIIDDGGPMAELEIRDGNDTAYFMNPGRLNVTVPQTFTFPAASTDRFGAVHLFVGSVAGGNNSQLGFRPSSIEISCGGSTAVFSDQLDSMDGKFWDTVRLGVAVPAGATSITAQIFSRDDGVVAPGNMPASLTWVASAFSVEPPPTTTCWITTGGFHNAGTPSGSKLYTFGGNVGPPPNGSWEVVDHVTGDNFHSNDVHITNCTTVGNGGPGQPGGKKGFKIDRADFAGTGRLNFVDGYPFVGYVEDAGEPSGKKGKNKDFFSITVFDPVSSAVVFHAEAELDGGNVQIHPPAGGK